MDLEKYKSEYKIYKTHTSFDKIFSNWIFIFFLIYVLRFKFFNPLFLLLVGIVYNIILYIYLVNAKYIVKSKRFIYVNIIIKVLPAIYLRNTKIMMKDIYMSLLFIILWIVYIKLVYGFDIYEEKHPSFFDYYISKYIRYLKSIFNKKYSITYNSHF